MVRKHGARWHYDFRCRGVRYRRAIPEARTKAQAEEAETAERNRIYQRKWGCPTGEANFKKFVTQIYLPWSRLNKRSYRDDESNSKTLFEYFGGCSLGEITQQRIEHFRARRMNETTVRGTPRMPASINRELATLSGIFRMAVDYGEVSENPCRRVSALPENNRRLRHLSFDEEDRLLAQLVGWREHLYPIVVTAIYAGLRKGELLSLKWSQVDLSLNALEVKESKTNRPRSVPMAPIVRAALEELRIRRTSLAVFGGLVDIKRSFATACRLAGIVDLRFHDLRHTFGTRLADAGVDVVKIAELMGHADIKTTMRYLHATDAGKRAAITILSEYRESRTRAQNCGQESGHPQKIAMVGGRP